MVAVVSPSASSHGYAYGESYTYSDAFIRFGYGNSDFYSPCEHQHTNAALANGHRNTTARDRYPDRYAGAADRHTGAACANLYPSAYSC